LIRFIKNILLFFGIPVLGLVLLYLITDPFKTLKQFDLQNVSIVNRDYLSTELFIKNNPIYKYDSFIFGSSRGCGLNTYLWKSYLPKDSRQFLFQAWNENITGISQKLKYLDAVNQHLNNVLILIDIPNTFDKKQELTDAMTIKDYKVSGINPFYFQCYLFKAYLKPSEVYKCIHDFVLRSKTVINFDTISNDWDHNNKNNWLITSVQNKPGDKSKFKDRPQDEKFYKQQIDKNFEQYLIQIRQILFKHHSNYRIVITPAYDQLHINQNDLQLLYDIFESRYVFNFSGKNKWTEDKYNFMDVNHFDLVLGNQIITECYQER
jgi:hypothetical protein